MTTLPISVPVGPIEQDYSIGDLLNAIDTVVSYYRSEREQTDGEICEALRLYAWHMAVEDNDQTERTVT